MNYLWDICTFLAKETAIYAGTYILASTVVSYLKEHNPDLTDRQCDHLHRLIDRAVYDYRKGNDITYALTAILALAVPDLDANILFQTVISEIDDSYDYRDDRPVDSSTAPPGDIVIEFDTLKSPDRFSDILINSYGISPDRALRIPLELRECLVELLQTSPSCPISLDEMIVPSTGQLKADTTVLFQYSEGKPHAYLFNRDSIEEWMTESNTNPLNRQKINKTTQYYQLT